MEMEHETPLTREPGRPIHSRESSINLTEPSVRLIARRKGVFGWFPTNLLCIKDLRRSNIAGTTLALVARPVETLYWRVLSQVLRQFQSRVPRQRQRQ